MNLAETIFPKIRKTQKNIRILSWNIRGLHSNHNWLDLLIKKYSPEIICLQEARVHYKITKNSFFHGNRKPYIKGYKATTDILFKTIIYVRNNLEHQKLPTKYYKRNINTNKTESISQKKANDQPNDQLKNIIYQTRIAIRGQNERKKKEIFIVHNTYNSPNGNTSAETTFSLELTDKDKKLFEKQKWKITNIKWIHMGDYNACHELWGSKKSIRRNDYRYIEGSKIANIFRYNNWDVISDGKPTRTYYKKREKIDSHLDIVSTNNIDTRRTKVNTLQHKIGSDHYPIIVDISTNITKLVTLNSRLRWNIKDDTNWTQFDDEVALKWYKKYPKDDKGKTNYSLDINQTHEDFIKCLKSTALENINYKKRNQKCKPWITKETQAACIEFHKYERFMGNLSSKNDKVWKKYNSLRNIRNRLIKHHKRRWIEHRFSEQRLEGKEGWKIANEVRGLFQHSTNIYPTLYDTNGKEYNKNKSKAEAFNEHYHRFDKLPDITPNFYHSQIEETKNDEKIPDIKNITIQRDNDYGLYQNKYNIQSGWEKKHTSKYDPIFNTSEKTELEKFVKIKIEEIEDEEEYQEYSIKSNKIMEKITKMFAQIKKKRCRKKQLIEIQKLNAKITHAELKRAVNGYKNDKSPGPDNIDVRMIKKCVKTQYILTDLLNEYFLIYQDTPDGIKNRYIIPIYKPGKILNQIASYRPISLTSYIAKTLEKILCCRLVNYIIKLRLLSECHFGYLKGRSTQDAVTYIVEKITNDFGNKKGTHSVFFDYSAAFDCVRIDVLLWKIKNEYGINGIFLTFLINFFRKRTSAVALGTIISTWKEDKIGVPQGGSLSPILFLIYIDGLGVLHKIPGLDFIIYADDLCLFSNNLNISKSEATQMLQFGVRYVQWYAAHLGLSLNPTKTMYQLFTRNSKISKKKLFFDNHIKANDISTPVYSYTNLDHITAIKHPDDSIRYLGYYLHSKLDWKHHTTKMLQKCNWIFNGMLKNIKKIWRIKNEIVIRIIETCVFSIIDYSSIFFILFPVSQRNKIEKFYKKTIKQINQCETGTSLAVHYRQYDLLSFENRWKQTSMKYFTSLIRTPKSGIVYNIIEKKYWKILKYIYKQRSILNPDDHHTILPALHRKYKKKPYQLSKNL